MTSRFSAALRGAVLTSLFAVAVGAMRPAVADTTIIPGAYANIEAADANGSPFNNGARTIQSIYDASQLSALPAGNALITGIALRLDRASSGNQTAPAPAVDLSFSSFDIYLGQAALSAAASDVSNNLNLNTSYVGGAAGKTLVRSGTLTVAANSYAGGPAGGPAPFGPVITFNTPYLYQGGGLVIELTHTGNGQIVFLVDGRVAETGFASHSDFGYQTTNTTFRAVTPITQLSFTAGVAPEPASIVLTGMGALLGLTVIRRRKRA